MNQAQGSSTTRSIRVDKISTPGYGLGDDEQTNKQETIKSHYGGGVEASDVTEDTQISERSWADIDVSNKAVRTEVTQMADDNGMENTSNTDHNPTEKIKTEGGELDLRDEGINIDNEFPKISSGDGIIKINNTTTKEEEEVARALADSLEESGLDEIVLDELPSEISREKTGEDKLATELTKDELGEKIGETSGMTENSHNGSLDKDEVDKFMDAKNTEMPTITEETATPENSESFGSADLQAKITNITETESNIAEINGLLEEKEQEIKRVEGSLVGILGPNNVTVDALVREAEEYRENLQEAKTKLQSQISELQELVQTSPEALAALKNNPEATAIPEIKTLLDSMVNATSTTGTGAVRQERASVDESAKLKSVEVVIHAGGHPGSGLARAIKEAISKLIPGLSNDELTKEVGKVFGEFTEGVLKELKADGQQPNEDVVSEYRAMVQALETSNGVIEVLLGRDGKMSAHIKSNTSETITSANKADDYNYQLAA